MNNIIKGIKLILSGLLSPFTIIINGIKELMYVGLRVQHIEDNLMYDTTPEVLSSKLIDVEHSVKNRMDGLAEINKSMREKIASNKNGIDNLYNSFTDLHCTSIDEVNKRLKKLEDETKTHMNCFNGSESSHLLYLIKELEKYHKSSGIEMYGECHPEVMLERIRGLYRDINELQLSLKSLTSKDLGTFNFISDKPTQLELDIIESEAKGELVVKEEIDWHYEQKAKNKQIQDRMRKDEAEIIW
mgnify:CR=1 FL=1